MRTLFFLIPLLTDYRTVAGFVQDCVYLGLVTAGLFFAWGSVQAFRLARRSRASRG